MNRKIPILAVGLLVGGGLAASAIEVDVTSGITFIGSGVYFQAVQPNGTGTGSFDSFSRFHATPFEKGVNTSIGTPVLYDNVNQGDHNFNHDLLTSNVGIVTGEGGLSYYLFQLDAGQSGQDPVSIAKLKM